MSVTRLSQEHWGLMTILMCRMDRLGQRLDACDRSPEIMQELHRELLDAFESYHLAVMAIEGRVGHSAPR